MDFQAKSETELKAVELLKKQRRLQQIKENLERFRLNSLVIFLIPTVLVVAAFILQSYGVGKEIFYALLSLFLVLFCVSVNERLNLLHALLLEKLDEK